MYDTQLLALAHERQAERLRQSAQQHLTARARRARRGRATWPPALTSRIEG